MIIRDIKIIMIKVLTIKNYQIILHKIIHLITKNLQISRFRHYYQNLLKILMIYNTKRNMKRYC